MTTWREKAKRQKNAPPCSLTELTEAHSVSFVSAQNPDIQEFSTDTAATLENIAGEHGIDWTAARSQMIEGDAEAGAAQLAADRGDGAEHASVACWLRLLADRASVDGLRAGGKARHAHAAASTNPCSSAKQGMAKGRIM